jgi:hypothetical protein
MVRRAQQAEAAQEVKRLTDYVHQGQQFEGEKLNFEKLLGEDFQLKDFAALPSKLADKQPAPAVPGAPAVAKEYLVMQVEWKGKIYVTSCGAAQVVDAVKQMPKQYLPVLLRVVKDKNPKTGRMFYRVE